MHGRQGPPTVSHPKVSLEVERLDAFLDIEAVRRTIAKNRELVAAWATDRAAEACPPMLSGLSGEQSPRALTFDGAVEVSGFTLAPVAAFFGMKGRSIVRRRNRVLRGVRYLVSIDPTLEVRQKLRILRKDLEDALSVASAICEGGIPNHSWELSAVLDYAKNASITILNALVQPEKQGQFSIEDLQYQRIRDEAVELAVVSTRIYYAYLLGRIDDCAANAARVSSALAHANSIVTYIEKQYVEGVFSSRFFTRPEAGHPTVLLMAALSALTERTNPIDTVIGLPSGGTELAILQQYIAEVTSHHAVDLLLIPCSLHSVKSEFDSVNPDRHGPLVEVLGSRATWLNEKHVLLVEDNSSTGRTLQTVVDAIFAATSPLSIDISVAEADVVRSLLDRNSQTRSHIADPSLYRYAVNMLPVSRKIMPKTDIREVAERRRLAAHYRSPEAGTVDVVERIKGRVFLEMVENPTMGVMPGLDDGNSVRDFRHSFLSNFYVTPEPVWCSGVSYPTVEHAYQAQKFSESELRVAPVEHLDGIRGLFGKRGRFWDGNVADVFRDSSLSAGNVKVAADYLRSNGYVRDDWDDVKIPLMISLLLKKFAQPGMSAYLLSTRGKYLVEVNTWHDTLWGISDGRGRNLLGLVLMDIRDNELGDVQ